MWLLFLNPITGQADEMHPVARAESKEELEQYLAAETVPAYQEEAEIHGIKRTITKTFRKDGPLEWFNAPNEQYQRAHPFSDIGTLDDHLEHSAQGVRQWWDNLMQVPELARKTAKLVLVS